VNVLQFGFWANGTRQRRIDSLALMCTRAFYDQPSRFSDFTKARYFTTSLLTPSEQETKLRDFLFQILMGAELLLRMRLQPAGTSYASIITDYISGLIVVADLFMNNVEIKNSPVAAISGTGLTTTLSSNPRYAFYAINHQRNAEGLIRFAEALSWPFMEEARRCIETAYTDLTTGRGSISYDVCDWLFGLILPGKFFRHRVMCALVDASLTTRNLGPAPYYDNGIVVSTKSYWPKRTVLGRVLGGVRHVKSVCGWVGPLPAPRGTGPTGGAVTGWIRLNARRLDIPIPVVKSARPLEDLGFTANSPESNEDIIESLVNPSEYITPTAPGPQPNQRASVLKAINLELVAQAPQSLGSLLTGLPTEEYRASLDFEVNGIATKYTLYSNPVFVTAPPCVGTHLIFRRQAEVMLREAVPVAILKDTYPPANKLLIIKALGEGDEVVARAWCAERGKHAVIRRDVPGQECCFACAANMARGSSGLNVNVLIWTK
jgi:hypothetical protein